MFGKNKWRNRIDWFPIVFVLVISIFVVMGVILSCFCEVGFDTGSGEQVGYISEIEHNGVFWKPAEIKLISIEPTYSSTDTVWYYGSGSDDITRNATQHMRNHDKVVVKYETRVMTFYWDYSHRIVITNIELIKGD
jgi:hypothetical protein